MVSCLEVHEGNRPSYPSLLPNYIDMSQANDLFLEMAQALDCICVDWLLVLLRQDLRHTMCEDALRFVVA